MGAANSAELRAEDYDDLEANSHFTRREIKRLYKRFKFLDSDDSGTIASSDLLSIPEFAMNPLNSRIVAVLNLRGVEQINFKQFVTTLSVFSPRATRLEKTKLAFVVYDVNGDGFITTDDVEHVLKLMVGENLSDEQITIISKRTIKQADRDRDEKLSFDEFAASLESFDVEGKMTIRL